MVESIGCLNCNKRIARLRGCCTTCYGRHRSAVRAGKTTWAKLEKRGLVEPAHRLGESWRRL
jgi:hypothetical protein